MLANASADISGELKQTHLSFKIIQLIQHHLGLQTHRQVGNSFVSLM